MAAKRRDDHREAVTRDEDGRVTEVKSDRPVKADDPLAVQVPEAADGTRSRPLDERFND